MLTLILTTTLDYMDKTGLPGVKHSFTPCLRIVHAKGLHAASLAHYLGLVVVVLSSASLAFLPEGRRPGGTA